MPINCCFEYHQTDSLSFLTVCGWILVVGSGTEWHLYISLLWMPLPWIILFQRSIWVSGMPLLDYKKISHFVNTVCVIYLSVLFLFMKYFLGFLGGGDGWPYFPSKAKDNCVVLLNQRGIHGNRDVCQCKCSSCEFSNDSFDQNKWKHP